MKNKPTPPRYYASRSDVPEEYRWKLHKIYSSAASWEKDYQSAQRLIAPLSEYRGKLKTSTVILRYFHDSSSVLRRIEKLYVYASHLGSTDLSDQQAQILTQRAQDLFVKFSGTVSFQGPELVRLSETQLKKMLAAPKFHPFHRELTMVLKKKKHILSDGEEALLSLQGKLSSGPEDIHSALDDIDLTFADVTDENGKKQQLTNGNYQGFLERQNRAVRHRAYENFYHSYRSHIHTFAQTLNLAVKQHHFLTVARQYKSCLESSLSGNMISSRVYTTLIKETHAILPALHKYFALRARRLGLKKLSMYDLRVNIVKAEPLRFSYDEAVQLCLDALAPLGEEYVRVLAEGLRGGWVDRYENKGKRGGAFSGGCFDTDPYILINFTGTLNDVYTLIHEAGHSMHSWYARTHQPYSLADYSLFTAEIASTVNERLLTAHLLKKFRGPQQKIVLAYEIDAIRATFFRQAMFAEFELNIHRMVEQGKPLTTEYFNIEYARLNALYHGPHVAQDDLIRYEWARIPHFYYNFYVYQYATGIAAAFYFAGRILAKRGRQESKLYLEFLKKGGDGFPLDQLRSVGLNFNGPEIYRAVAKNLRKCLNQI